MRVAVALRLLVVVALLAVAPAVEAQMIHRCRTTDGVTLFSDRPCHTHGATPIAAPEPMPGTLVAPGIVLHHRHDPDIPDAANGCPAEHPYQLRERMRDALLHGDINALAGLYAWDGASRQQADRVLRDMRSLIDDRAHAIRLLEDGWLAGSPTSLPRPEEKRVMDGLPDYHLVRSAGCVWLAG